MLLSDLVKFRNSLIIKLEQLDLDQAINNLCSIINSLVSENPDVDHFSAHGKITHAINEYQKLLAQSNDIKTFLSTSINDTNIRIDQIAASITNDLNYQVENVHTVELDDTVAELILSKIQKYSDWHFPGLRLGCRYVGGTSDNALSRVFSNPMVANDPLYFCDFTLELIENITNHYPEQYINRIRKYVINDHNLTMLPQNQFGFVFSWWLFNFIDLPTLELYLRSTFNVLRPGGGAIFSYNNCDLYASARVFEKGFMAYTPKRLLFAMCEQVGFEIVDSQDKENIDPTISYISWIEIKKPGDLTTIKRAQAMGAVLSK
jgi:hypothetical protein